MGSSTPRERWRAQLERALAAQKLSPDDAPHGTIGRAETMIASGEDWPARGATLEGGSETVHTASGQQAPDTWEPAELRALQTSRARLPALSIGPDSDYQPIGALGEGGMGVVELASQPVLGRHVALKRLKPSRARDPKHVDALLAEASIMGRLEHPNLIPVHGVGLDPELGPVVVMKRVQGEVWTKLLDQDAEARLAGDEVALARHIEYLVQLCNALHFAHSHRIIHRDVKPDNIMLGLFGEIYILDWGVALDRSALRSGEYVLAGTPGFMAPEMVLGPAERIDARSDVYLFGATLHLILTGRRRHEGASLTQVLEATLESPPVQFPPCVPTELAQICNKACAKDPSDRFQDILAFQRALVDYLERHGARQLSNAAHRQLEALREAIAAGCEDERIQRLFIEARFAFEQARQALPDEPANERARQQLLAEMLDYELARDNALGARAILNQLDSPSPSQVERIDEAEARQAARNARFEYLESEVDPDTVNAGRLKLALFVEFLALVTAVLTFSANPSLDSRLSAQQLFSHICVTNAIVFTAIFTVWRKKIFATHYNKRLFQFVFMIFSFMFINRLGGMLADTPVVDTLRNEIVIVAASMLLARIPGNRVVPLMGGVVVLVAIVAGAWPITTRVAYYLTLDWTFELRDRGALVTSLARVLGRLSLKLRGSARAPSRAGPRPHTASGSCRGTRSCRG